MPEVRPSLLVRPLQHLAVELPPVEETASIARERLGAKFPRPALRRMTHLGLLLGSVLDGVALSPEDAVVYASTYAETCALESYLTSFPTPSPALFQTSIHPGGVQQVLIGRQQPVARLWPLAGRQSLFEQALIVALLEPSARVVIVGGEERGTWMLEHGMASDRSFAFALVLGPVGADLAGGVGALSLDPTNGASTTERCPALLDAAIALAARQSLSWNGEYGRVTVTLATGSR